jgi:hypothetical protein
MTVRWPLLGARYRTEAFTVTRPTREFKIAVPVSTVAVVGAVVVTAVDGVILNVFKEFPAIRRSHAGRRVDRRGEAVVDGVGVDPCGDRRLTRDVANTADVFTTSLWIAVFHVGALAGTHAGIHEVVIPCVADDSEQSIRAVRTPKTGHDGHRFREGANVSLIESVYTTVVRAKALGVVCLHGFGTPIEATRSRVGARGHLPDARGNFDSEYHVGHPLNSCYKAGFKCLQPERWDMPEHHDDEEYLDAIRDGNHATSDIADAVGVARQSADERLRRLAEVREVEHETVGNSLYWTLVDDE